MEDYRCPDCLENVAEDDLTCPSCGAELFEDDDEDIVDVEPVGPPPLEYKCVLIAAIVLVLGALLWGWLSQPSQLMLK